MPRDAAYWQRRYERAEAGRLQALDQVAQFAHDRIDTAADDMQQQVDALEQLVLSRAMLVAVESDGRTLRFKFTRRGQVHQIDTYNAMGLDVAEIRKVLLED